MRCFFGSFPYETTENSYPQKRKLPTKKKGGVADFTLAIGSWSKKNKVGIEYSSFGFSLFPLLGFCGGFLWDSQKFPNTTWTLPQATFVPQLYWQICWKSKGSSTALHCTRPTRPSLTSPGGLKPLQDLGSAGMLWKLPKLAFIDCPSTTHLSPKTLTSFFSWILWPSATPQPDNPKTLG